MWCGFDVISRLAIILLSKSKSWLVYLSCLVTVCVLCLFIAVPLVGLQSVIMAFPGDIHLRFGRCTKIDLNHDPVPRIVTCVI